MRFLRAGVEGWVDKAVLERIFAGAGIDCTHIRDYGGCPKLDADIPKYLEMSRTHAVCVLRDLDLAECAPTLLRQFGVDKAPNPANMIFRIPVRQIEAWLLADGDAFARHFKVPKALVPKCPDGLVDAKAEVLKLIRRSNSPSVKEAMLPREGYSNRTGPEYASALRAFASKSWNPELARSRSPSLDRSLRALQAFKLSRRI